MDEASALERLIDGFDVPRETFAKLEALVALLAEENQRQNLVSNASLYEVWNRHILDSVQLLTFAVPNSSWLDLGTGAGFPGLVIAALHNGPVTLVEERRLRAEFLARAANTMALRDQVTILCAKAEKVEAGPFDVISARAFAPLDKLFALGERFSTAGTRWILPKGRNAQSELEAAEASWQGVFRLEPSVTDPEARIIVAEQVRRKRRGSSPR